MSLCTAAATFPFSGPRIVALKGQLAGGGAVGCVEVKGGVLKDLLAKANYHAGQLQKEHQDHEAACGAPDGLQHCPRTRTSGPGLGPEATGWSVIKPKVVDGVGQSVHPVCHRKPNCTQPGPVGRLWDLLCREQVSDMLCPFAEIISHKLESQTPRPSCSSFRCAK